MTSNPHLSAVVAAGTADHVGVAWDRGNDQWWDWYMSLAANPAEAGPLAPGPEPYAGPLPTDAEVEAELAVPYELEADAVAFFAAESYVKLPGVLSPGTVERLRLRLRDARVVPAPTMISGDWQKFVPGTGPGEVAASERNPVVR